MKKNDTTPPDGNSVLEGQLETFGCWLQNQGCSAVTIGQYVGVCRKFGRYLDEHDVALDTVHDGHVDDFLAQLEPQRGSLVESRRYHRTGIGRLLNYLHDAGICPTPIDPYLDGYARQLRERGYTEKTIAQYVGACRRLGCYVRRVGIELDQLSEHDIDTFVDRLPLSRARQPERATIRRDYRRRLRLLLSYLRESGACPPADLPTTTDPSWVTDYLAFLRDHRGLSEATIKDERRHLLRFLAHVGIDGTTDQLRLVSVQHADEFLIEAARGRKRTSMRYLCAAIRGFFRFLHMRGVLPANLSEQVTTPLIYRQEGMPRAIPWADVERTLGMVDCSTLVGRRDYAILSLLVY